MAEIFKYIYKGNEPYNGTIRLNGKDVELFMEKEGEYSLPSDHQVIADMKAQGLLIEREAEAKKKAEPAKVVVLTDNSKNS